MTNIWHMMFTFMTHDIHDITKSRPRRSRSRQAPSPQSPQSPAEQPWTENRWGKASKHETETYRNCRKPRLFAISFWSLFCFLGWNLNQVSAVRLKPLHSKWLRTQQFPWRLCTGLIRQGTLSCKRWLSTLWSKKFRTDWVMFQCVCNRFNLCRILTVFQLTYQWQHVGHM